MQCDKKKVFLITGSAGFIGASVSKCLLEKGESVIGIDNINDYYDINLKKARLKEITKVPNLIGGKWDFRKIDLNNSADLEKLFIEKKPNVVINLAAQAGVRYSIENPSAYIQSNLVGFYNLLECCRKFEINNLIYASSSSVYGGNQNLPFKEKHTVDHPISLYAATKRSNELIAHSYSHLYNIPCTGLRFFTVYGPWGRPDMALFLFTKSILNNEPIKVFNKGQMIRDFTFVDDVVESLIRILNKPPTSDDSFNTDAPNPSRSWAPHKVFNIGNSKPTQLIEYIKAIEDELGIKAKKLLLPMQPGDVAATESDSSQLQEWINFKPNTTIREGIKKFIKWYKEFYGI